MNIMVTGANGFIGQHLCQHLLAMGHVVTSVVRRAGTSRVGTIELVMTNIGADTDWSGRLAGQDVIIHLAGRAHVMIETTNDPLTKFRQVNVGGTGVLSRAASSQGVTRFVFLSSIKVNGEETADSPFRASDLPHPKDPYGQSKLEAEDELRELERSSPLETVIVRTPLVYGPLVRGNFLRTLFLAQRAIPLPLASIQNHRTMCSIWNLVDLLERCAVEQGARAALVLAGDSYSPSTAQLFQELSRALDRPSRIFPCPIPILRVSGLLTHRSSIISRLTGSLEVEAGSSSNDWAWVPKVGFRDGIARTAKWFRADRESKGQI